MIEDSCVHGWTTPPECPQCIEIQRDELLLVVTDLVRACESSMNWMEQVDRAKLSSSTRGILHADMGMTKYAISKAKQLLFKIN